MTENPNQYMETSAKLLRVFHRRLTKTGIDSQPDAAIDLIVDFA